MRIPHTSPRKLDKKWILLMFKGDRGAEAFDEWFEFQGGSEAFAAWVLNEQAIKGKFKGLVIEDDKQGDEEEW